MCHLCLRVFPFLPQILGNDVHQALMRILHNPVIINLNMNYAVGEALEFSSIESYEGYRRHSLLVRVFARVDNIRRIPARADEQYLKISS